MQVVLLQSLTINYSNHPDTNSSGSIGNGDLGMFWDYRDPGETSGQACSVTVANNLMNNIGAYVDAAVGFQTLISCAGRLSDVELPAVGSSVDLSTALANVDISGQDFTISAASM